MPQNPKNNTNNNKKKQPMKNVWQEKPGARAQNSTPPQQLYSAAVKKNTNHDFDVSQVMSQMSQMMTQHHAIVNTSNTFENTSVILHVGNNTKITVACIYRPPHGSINTIELDAILNHSNKAFLFGDFNAKHSSWNPGRSNTNGNILCNWAVGSALDIIAPDTPTHFNAWHTNNILDIGFAANLAHTDVFTINALSSDHNPVIFDFITNNILSPILRTLKSTNWIKFQEILYHNVPGNPQIDNLDTAVQNFTDVITNAISASTSTRVINTPHLRLPENIRELIRAKIDSENSGTTPDINHTNAKLTLSLDRSGKKSKHIKTGPGKIFF
ncbi:RNA-directed DNA polymerase from mobile element jockey [Trichonephila clavipes]|nr:RNA-directed DNA polymerase from mobile element jockey [Trichonephila clavipes]